MTSIRDICIDFLAECDEYTGHNGYIWDELERYMSTDELADFVCFFLRNNPEFKGLIDDDDHDAVYEYTCER